MGHEPAASTTRSRSCTSTAPRIDRRSRSAPAASWEKSAVTTRICGLRASTSRASSCTAGAITASMRVDAIARAASASMVPIQRHDAAERGQGVGLARAHVGVGRVGAGGDAARVGVLHDHARRARRTRARCAPRHRGPAGSCTTAPCPAAPRPRRARRAPPARTRRRAGAGSRRSAGRAASRGPASAATASPDRRGAPARRPTPTPAPAWTRSPRRRRRCGRRLCAPGRSGTPATARPAGPAAARTAG